MMIARQLAWIIAIFIFMLVLASSIVLFIYMDYHRDSYSTLIGGNNSSGCPAEFAKYCLNEGNCVYLKEEQIVSCNCREPYGGKRCEDYLWWYT